MRSVLAVLGAALCLLVLIFGPARTVAAQCGPFGNAPRGLTPDLVPLTCSGGTMMAPWSDSDGNTRVACLYEPASASAANPLPLLVYIHPSLFTADTVSVATNILDYLDTGNLSGDPARPGFIVVAPEGRSTTHFYPMPDDQGPGWDNWYRQLERHGRSVVVDGVTYPQNVDAATIDHFIDQEVATGKVDPKRVYVTGWSNGAAMGFLYALNRRRIAAAALYTAPNPFEAFNDPCPQLPVRRRARSNGEIRVFNRRVPFEHVHNACDIAGICPNGELLVTQMLPLRARLADVIIDGSQNLVLACDPACGTNPDADMNPADNPLGFTEGSVNHTRWPNDWTETMLAFLRQYRGHRR
jgi:pimeloyl-ACP methyl ester carboxylesterase